MTTTDNSGPNLSLTLSLSAEEEEEEEMGVLWEPTSFFYGMLHLDRKSFLSICVSLSLTREDI
jgi:hypothetical protein